MILSRYRRCALDDSEFERLFGTKPNASSVSDQRSGAGSWRTRSREALDLLWPC